MYVGYKKHLILIFCIRFMIGSYYIFLTVVLIMSLLYAAQFFVTAADVVTEALARLVGYQWRFSQRVCFWNGVSSRCWFDDVRCCIFVTFV